MIIMQVQSYEKSWQLYESLMKFFSAKIKKPVSIAPAPATTEVEVWVNADGSIRQKSWFEFSEPGKDWTLLRATIHAGNVQPETP